MTLSYMYIICIIDFFLDPLNPHFYKYRFEGVTEVYKEPFPWWNGTLSLNKNKKENNYYLLSLQLDVVPCGGRKKSPRTHL